jgi:hypothetical protein
MESTQITQGFSFESKNNFNVGKNSQYVWNVKIFISNIVDVFTRKYFRLKTVFANVGGFLKTILMLFMFISNFINSKYFIDDLFLYSF